ncbi:MAG: hypothetical protein H7A50_00645 [Akkermansiaceae bacterium]|nr:hypothetical protein [Akkermansiaceae bacterium]
MSPEPSAPVKRKGCLGRFILVALLVLLVAYGSLILARGTAPLEFVIRVLIGWVFHLRDAGLPAVMGNAGALWFPLACLVLAGWMAHRFLVWWAAARNRTWRPGTSACLVALFVLASASAIAMSGVFHQMMWLAGSKIVESNRRTNLTMAINNLRQLWLVVMDFEAEHGRHAESLEELVAIQPDVAPLIYLRTLDDESPPERVAYLRPDDASFPAPLFVGPWIDGKVPVAFTDGSVRSVSAKEATRLLAGKPAESPADE